MAKSKNGKDHKKRILARANKIAESKKTNDKLQREFVMDMIKKEQDKGLFVDLPSINGLVDSSVVIDGPTI